MPCIARMRAPATGSKPHEKPQILKKRLKRARYPSHMCTNTVQPDPWANLQDFRQLGGDGQVSRHRLCSLEGDAIDMQIQFLQFAGLALAQSVADDNGTFVFQLVPTKPTSRRQVLSVGYSLKFELLGKLTIFSSARLRL